MAGAAVSQTPEPTPVEDNDVVKISTNLIQIDVTVVDSNGRPITDLRQDEIEIFENGKKQDITNFSFINGQTRSQVTEISENKAEETIIGPPVQLRPEQVRRTIALIVDDLRLSFESIYQVRRGLKNFVDQQMQPGDLVAIVRTGSGMGSLQQFTSDKRQLYAAIENLKWRSVTGRTSAFAPIRPEPKATKGFKKFGDEDEGGEKGAFENLDEFYDEIMTAGTLGAANYVIKGLGELPGRKSAILFSDGLKIDSIQERDSLNALIELANRSSVVIYTIDARGLVTTGLTGADDTSQISAKKAQEMMQFRTKELWESQEGLSRLALATGGIRYINANNVSKGIERAVADQSSYYLVGYQPDDSTFDPLKRKYNSLSVKVTRRGASVRFRSGFFNVAEGKKNETTVVKTPTQQLVSALSSPFFTGQIAIKLTPILMMNDKRQSFISSFIHVKATDMKFVADGEGWKKVQFDVVAAAFSGSGSVVDQIGRTETLRIRDSALESIQRTGFVYTVQFPIKNPGAYQMRVALRDTQTSNIGSANQFIEVPNIKKNHFVLSGIALQDDRSENGTGVGASRHDAALRKFKPGSTMSYHLSAYTSGSADKAPAPKLKKQVRIFHEGKLVFTGTESEAVSSLSQKDGEVILGGSFSIGSKMQPGDYVLHITVTDPAAKPKQRTKVQWIDFEVIN